MIKSIYDGQLMIKSIKKNNVFFFCESVFICIPYFEYIILYWILFLKESFQNCFICYPIKLYLSLIQLKKNKRKNSNLRTLNSCLKNTLLKISIYKINVILLLVEIAFQFFLFLFFSFSPMLLNAVFFNAISYST